MADLQNWLKENSLENVEWRQLTVMFCDVVGFTELAERVDAERLRQVIKAYRSTAARIITRYDGHISQYLGDGVMAYFGYPGAHEDDAERCVRAALDLVGAVKGIEVEPRLLVRVGVATGRVIVGDGPDGKPELAVGETPILAERLQKVAQPGQIVIGPATRHLIGDVFELGDLGPLELKHVTEPVRGWRVDALHRTEGRFEATRETLALTPFVGRDEEMAVLLRAWREACSGKGQVVLVCGEAGIGKSRLTHVLRERIAETPHARLRYQCSPYHANSALYPVIDRMEVTGGFAREDTVEQRLDKMEALLVGTAAQIADAAPLFASLLSIASERYPQLDLSPQKRLERTLEALAGQIEALARDTPVLIVFEDCHWIDPTSQKALDLIVQRLRDLPVLLIVTHRPTYTFPSIDTHITTLGLERLPRGEGAELVAALTSGKPLPHDVLEQIVDRTDGVPLFLEELTKSVLESGQLRDGGDKYTIEKPLRPLAIPTTLQDLLKARLDRLAPVKGIIQMAACIGREFSRELLARSAAVDDDALDDALATLTDAGLIFKRASPGESVYVFKHALVQDAAYASLLTEAKQELHSRIARTLKADFASRVTNEPELLARHFTEAGHHAEAVRWWCEAGKVAAHRVALREATAHFQTGLSLSERVEPAPTREALQLSIREPFNAVLTALGGWAAPEVGANAAAILTLTSQHGASQTRRTGLWAMWVNTTTQGRIADSLEWAHRLLAEGEQAGDLDLRIFGHGAAMISNFYLGRLLQARHHGARVLALYDPQHAQRWMQVTAHDLRTLVGVWACQWTWMLGSPEEAVRLSDEKDAYARGLGDAFNLGFALTLGAYAFDYRREPERLLERVAEVERFDEERSVPFMTNVMVPQAKGLALLRSGRLPEAIASLRLGLHNWQVGGGYSRVPYLKSALAEALALNGEMDAALVLIDECLEQIARPGWEERSHWAEVLRLKAWMLMQHGRVDEAEGLLRDAIEWAREQEARSWELRAATTLATLLKARGQDGNARSVLQPVYESFSEGSSTPDLVAARGLLESLADDTVPVTGESG